ncbi:hypothetical protein COU75_02865 [Candidatus Peregrinibacteria bacterium CG10_big_fil_rev_8_21_14_0_10_42_8]|nr:MAG: hypothetical protein COU75_02865 [Candidatus Peregrinibacteria bacterium CG10_big_fil_rev_8_21_14_0_10_42_8]
MTEEKMHRYILIALSTAIVLSFAGLIARCYYEMSGVMYGDTMIFQTVGRGILNGILPYSGLFETKPPGIFLMHTASLWLFDSQLLVKILQVLALVSIPVLVLIPSIENVSMRPAQQRQLVTLVTILFGLVLSLYVANQAGMGLVESYGVALALLYLVLLQCWDQGLGPWKVFTLGVLMLLTIGLKEPFLLILLSCVLLLQKNLLRSFVYPFCIAAMLGLAALFLLGYLEPFFSVYLKHMLGFHVYQQNAPFVLRALQIWRTFINMGAYSWWLACAVSLLWVYSFSKGYIIRMVCSSYLFFLAIAIGGDFYGHHFIFAVPCFVVFFWNALRRDIFLEKIIFGFLGLLILASLHTQLVYDVTSWRLEEKEFKEVASVIDTVMDRCGYTEYIQMIPRGGGPFAYTKHSPSGPIFIHYSRFIGASPMYQEKYIAAVKEVPLAFVLDIETSNFTDFAKEFIRANFSEVAPSCAGEDFMQPSPYYLLFRSS